MLIIDEITKKASHDDDAAQDKRDILITVSLVNIPSFRKLVADETVSNLGSHIGS
jgi:hypothetical protein